MTTIIGLRSGKEFWVQDKSYMFKDQQTGSIVRIYVTEDDQRLVVVKTDDIEYYDEPIKDGILESLGKTTKIEDQPIAEVFHDPNIS